MMKFKKMHFRAGRKTTSATMLEKATTFARQWVGENVVTFDTAKTEAVLLTRRKAKIERGIRVGRSHLPL